MQRCEVLHTAISRKVSEKMCTRQSEKVIWDMIDIMFLTTVAVDPATRDTTALNDPCATRIPKDL